MASPEPSLSLVGEPAVNTSRAVSVRTDQTTAPKWLMVDAHQISVTFETAAGKVEALSSVDLKVAEGAFVSFIGPSGCGKTPMLRVIADLQQRVSIAGAVFRSRAASDA